MPSKNPLQHQPHGIYQKEGQVDYRRRIATPEDMPLKHTDPRQLTRIVYQDDIPHFAIQAALPSIEPVPTGGMCWPASVMLVSGFPNAAWIISSRRLHSPVKMLSVPVSSELRALMRYALSQPTLPLAAFWLGTMGQTRREAYHCSAYYADYPSEISSSSLASTLLKLSARRSR